MEIRDLWRSIRKHLALIVIITLAASLTSGVLSKKVLSKEYSSTATLMVVPHESAQTLLTTMVTGQQLTSTYAQLATSSKIVAQMSNSLHLKLSVPKLTRMIKASPQTSTDLLDITVTDTSPTLAARIANAVSQNTVAMVNRIDGQNDLEIALAAAPSSLPVSPKTKTNVAIAFVLGLIVSSGLAFLLEFFDDSIHAEEDVKRYFGDWAMLTVIPVLDTGKLPSSKKMAKASKRAHARARRRETAIQNKP